MFRDPRWFQRAFEVIESFDPSIRSIDEILALVLLISRIMEELPEGEDMQRAKELLLRVGDERNSYRLKELLELLTGDEDDSWIDL